MPVNGRLTGTPQQLRQHYESLLICRKALLHTVPITHPDITDVEQRLLDHPCTDMQMRFNILARCIWVSALLYDHEYAGPLLKDQMLLAIREHFHAYQKLPERWQDALAPMWANWLDVLNDEESRWKEAADA
jgi:hypothetical protein